MILVIDSLNKNDFPEILDEMFRLRGRVFGGRLGWEVEVADGREIDAFDALDPVYVIGLDDAGRVISCARALQTTGPHMLADVFSAILCGEPPLRSATLWESTRFCVDTERLTMGRGSVKGTVSHATCELMIGSLEYLRSCGITDIVTVIDPVMDRVLKRSENAPYGYVGETVPMGKVPAMAALLDTGEERVERVRAFSGIEGSVFADAQALARLKLREEVLAQARAVPAEPATIAALVDYLDAQLSAAQTPAEAEAVRRLARGLASGLTPELSGPAVIELSPSDAIDAGPLAALGSVLGAALGGAMIPGAAPGLTGAA